MTISKRQLARRLDWPYTTLIHRMRYGTTAANWKAIIEAMERERKERQRLLDLQRRPVRRLDKWRER